MSNEAPARTTRSKKSAKRKRGLVLVDDGIATTTASCVARVGTATVGAAVAAAVALSAARLLLEGLTRGGEVGPLPVGEELAQRHEVNLDEVVVVAGEGLALVGLAVRVVLRASLAASVVAVRAVGGATVAGASIASITSVGNSDATVINLSSNESDDVSKRAMKQVTLRDYSPCQCERGASSGDDARWQWQPR